MKFSASQAAKAVGKSTPTITRAIKNGKLSATPRNGGGWVIEASELFRVWPPITNEDNVTPKMLGHETPPETSMLQREVELLREMLDDVKSDRDYWREQAGKITSVIEDHSRKTPGFWSRLFR